MELSNESTSLSNQRQRKSNIVEFQGSRALFENKILWTLDDLVSFTGFKERTIYNYVSKRKIPYRKQCSKLFFVPSEILNWIEEGDFK